MPISKKILQEIQNLDVEQKEKDFILEILMLEDEGIKHYKNDYDKKVNRYIADEEE